MGSFFRRCKSLFVSAGLFASLAVAPSLNARSIDAALETEQKLQKGEVVVGMKGEGETRLVTGTVLIDETPDNVWRVVVNPYEFRGKISPRMKDFQLLVDKRDRSVMRVNMDVLLIPHFNYVVESIYKPGEKIEFHRMKGTEQSLRDFNGSWEIQPRANGTKTALTYSMYMDPGFFVPQWLIREGVKGELPRTLSAIRKRVEAISANREKLATQTIAAASILPEAIAGKSAVNPL